MLTEIFVSVAYDGQSFFGFPVKTEQEEIVIERDSKIGIITMLIVCCVITIVYESSILYIRKSKREKDTKDAEKESISNMSEDALHHMFTTFDIE